MAFLLGTSVVTLSIALVFALKGYWMIFPFAGLELAALAVCFYLVANSARRREVVSITDALVTVEKGELRRGNERGGPDSREEFPRCWTRVELSESTQSRHTRRLWIGAYGRRVELAEFLPDHEKQGLEQQLKKLIRGTGSAAQAHRSGSSGTTISD